MSSATSAKDRIRKIVEEQPDDSSFDEILKEIAFVRMVDRGLADSDAGRTVSHEEVKRRIAEWRQSGGPTKRSSG
ncbi:MAG TPA: hypothetical protein VNB06_16900 [Thermoanaerobaculia bacterium]|nr:hypothetical protein [Thermoanaerobaculia bacterium]